jgi:hypothetical protein
MAAESSSAGSVDIDVWIIDVHRSRNALFVATVNDMNVALFKKCVMFRDDVVTENRWSSEHHSYWNHQKMQLQPVHCCPRLSWPVRIKLTQLPAICRRWVRILMHADTRFSWTDHSLQNSWLKSWPYSRTSCGLSAPPKLLQP